MGTVSGLKYLRRAIGDLLLVVEDAPEDTVARN